MNQTKDEWKKLLEEVESTGHEFDESVERIAKYAAERTAYLSTIVGQPGFDQAYIAERDNVLLKAGVEVADLGDAADQRIFGIVAGGLRIGATALAGVV